jgi:hypothetical protein
MSDDGLTADKVRQLALANLAKRASKGDRLSDEEWRRLDDYHRAEKPDPVGDALADLQAHVDAIKAKGKRPPAALVKLLREAALRDVDAHVWKDAGAAAKDLGVSVQSVRNWCDEMGIQHARQAIAKADLYRGLWQRAREQATDGRSSADDEEQALRIAERQAKLDERTGRLVQEANDAARQGLIRAVAAIRHTLTTPMPAAIADQLHGVECDRLSFEAGIRDQVLAHIEQATTATPTEPTP